MSEPEAPPPRRSTHIDVAGAAPAAPAPAPAALEQEPETAGSEEAQEDAPRNRRRTPVLIGLTAVIVVLFVAIAAVATTIATTLANRAGGDDGPAGPPAGAPEPIVFPADTPAAAVGAGPCTEVRVLSSFENAEMVEKLAEAYNAAPRDVGGTCVTVSALKQKSGVAAADAAASFASVPAAQRPALWLPDSSMWLAAAGPGASLGEPTAVGYSEIIPAMPQSMAAAIRWDEKAPTWAEVLLAGADADIWASHQHSEWGAFKLGKTSPLVASSGAAAMLASYGVAAGHVGAVTAADVADAEVRAEVHEQELATSHYMATPEHFLWHARRAEASGSAADFLSAVIVDEKSVWDYNRGVVSRDGVTRTVEEPPADPLVPIYPADGAYVADNPIVAVAGDGVDAATRAASADFVRFTQTREGQAVVRAAGYRDLNRELDDEVERTGRLSTKGSTIELAADGAALVAAQKAFPEVRKRANVLFLLDVSGSMDEKISASQTKLSQAKQAIEAALGHFAPGDRIGLAAFAQREDGKLVPGQLTPMGDIGENRGAFVKALKGISSMGDTPLYQAVEAFARQQASGWDAERINAIVLLSDGENDVKVATTGADAMKATLAGIHHDTPVLIFALAYGRDADVKTLQDIAAATGAHYYDATDPTQLDDVLGDLVTSF